MKRKSLLCPPCCVLLLTALLLWTTPTHSDSLTTDGGEVLSGKLLRVEDGALIFLTTLSGQMMAPMDTVEALTTARNLLISMRDGGVHYGRLEAQGGSQYLIPLDGSEKRPIALAEIKEIMVIPKAPQAGDAGSLEEELAQWRSSVRLGMLQRFGSDAHSQAFLDLELQYKKQDLQLQNSIRLESRGGQEAPQVLQAESRLLGQGESRWRPLVLLETERNIDTGLRWRTGLSLGLVYPFQDRPETRIEASLGLQGALEKWRPHDQDFSIFQDEEAKSKDELSARLGLRYSSILFGDSTLSEEITLLPSLSSLGDWRARSETALTLPVKAGLGLHLNLLLDYDNAPEYRNVKRLESAIGASIQWDF